MSKIENVMDQELAGLRKFASNHGLRSDWHEPDEQGVTARVVGDHLDNAYGNEIRATAVEQGFQEFVVVLEQENGDCLKINLATLLALAAR